MIINRFQKITRHRIFRDFTWPETLPDFAEWNLIYGWNGAGKTTLSRIFRAIEKRSVIADGNVEVVVHGRLIPSSDFSINKALPRVRVFNRDYIEACVFKSGAGGIVDPIYVFGEDSVENQKEINRLKETLEREQAGQAAVSQAKTTADRRLDNFRSEKAAAIKNLIGNGSTQKYRYYNKSDFGTKADALEADPQSALKIIDDETKQKLIARQQERPKEKIRVVAISLNQISEFKTKAAGLLTTKVVAQTIERLIANPNIATWVERGMHLHNNGQTSCEFCGGPISKSRIDELERHFNDQLKLHVAELDEMLTRIESDQATLQNIKLPITAEFYAELESDYSTCKDDLNSAISAQQNALAEIAILLREKRSKPFELHDSTGLEKLPEKNHTDVAIESVNKVIEKHNRQSTDFISAIESGRNTLEEHFVAESLVEYKGLKNQAASATSAATELANRIDAVTKRIEELNLEIAQHARPAEELNRELSNYLGRKDLMLKVEGPGYTITRNGSPAEHLSEGEKTAIAFLHFLKNLESNVGENAFDLKSDIVVIDDPVSSLDANALFCAFSFLRERTKASGQLFILTHNFTFFGLVKNWFDYVKKPKKARFFMLQTRGNQTERESIITQLDPTLVHFKSEYQFLFSKIYAEANSTSQSNLVDLYAMPNIARRFLESFLYFRLPALPSKSSLDERIQKVAPHISEIQKVRIIRFLHTFSHDNKLSEEAHDIFILSETRDILKELLLLVKDEDEKHFQGMIDCCQKTPEADASCN